MEKKIIDLTEQKFIFKNSYTRDGIRIYEFVFENTRIMVTDEQLEKMGYY